MPLLHTPAMATGVCGTHRRGHHRWEPLTGGRSWGVGKPLVGLRDQGKGTACSVFETQDCPAPPQWPSFHGIAPSVYPQALPLATAPLCSLKSQGPESTAWGSWRGLAPASSLCSLPGVPASRGHLPPVRHPKTARMQGDSGNCPSARDGSTDRLGHSVQSARPCPS